jgi:hypothetical protein
MFCAICCRYWVSLTGWLSEHPSEQATSKSGRSFTASQIAWAQRL